MADEINEFEQGYRVATSMSWEKAVSDANLNSFAMADLLAAKVEEAELTDSGDDPGAWALNNSTFGKKVGW